MHGPATCPAHRPASLNDSPHASRQEIGVYKVHPATNIFATAAGVTRDDLLASIGRRGQRAWNCIKTAYFAVDEHDRLRAALGAVIAMEAAMTSGSSRENAS